MTSPQDVYILGLMDVFWVNVWTSCKHLEDALSTSPQDNLFYILWASSELIFWTSWKRCLEDVLGTRCVPAGWGAHLLSSKSDQPCANAWKLFNHQKPENCRKLFVLQMSGNCWTTHSPGNSENTAEHDQKLIRPGESHNDFTCRIWNELAQRFVWKWAEASKVWRNNG